MWQRWNQTTHIFEKSTDNGVSWSPLGLSGSIITEGTIPDSVLSPNVILGYGYKPNQTITTALTVRGDLGIADLQLFDASRNRLWRLLSYLDQFKVWHGNDDNFDVTIDGQIRSRGTQFELGRAQAQGQRITWPAVIYTAAGHNCGGSITAFYSLIGYQLWWSIYAVNISIPVVSPYMLITLPPGYPSISGYTDQPIVRCFVPGIGDEPGYCQIDPLYIQVYRMKAINWTVGTGHLIGQGFYWVG